jgi:hypothetical protein
MAITKHILVDGPRNLVIKTVVDGNDETGTVLVDVTDHDTERVRIDRVEAHLNGFEAKLLWEADDNTTALDIHGNQITDDFSKFGGLTNPEEPGATGNLLITTENLGGNDSGTIILWMTKKGA